MARQGAVAKQGRGIHGLVTSLVLLLMVVGGFAIGLAVGFVMEEPTLVAGHIAGQTTAIDWGPESDNQPGVSLAPVGAGPPSVAAQRPEGDFDFSIQVGAFGDPALAASLADHLRSAGYPVQILEPLADERWRVRVGPLEEEERAEALARRLKQENRLPTWIIREPKG
ncbi:MAG: SPOR domain-containing protein [Myxococcota bacterium]|jgi:cell division septation protein DedD|nr:SPOR domain-containing protein [Myxococcota bacterium]